MTKPRQLPPLKGQSEMRANLSLPLPPFSAPPSLAPSCPHQPPHIFFFFLQLSQYVYLEPPWAPLSKTTRNGTIHVQKKGHAEREKEGKGLAAALPVCFLFAPCFMLKGERFPLVVVAAALAAILALCTHQNPSNLSVHLISRLEFTPFPACRINIYKINLLSTSRWVSSNKCKS